jgi:hypothetical protein
MKSPVGRPETDSGNICCAGQRSALVGKTGALF